MRTTQGSVLYTNAACSASAARPGIARNAPKAGSEARTDIGVWIETYNANRGHSGLDNYTPDEVYNDIHLQSGYDPRKGELKKAA